MRPFTRRLAVLIIAVLIGVLTVAVSVKAADKVELNVLVASNAQAAFVEILKEYAEKHPNVSFKPQWLGGSTIAKKIDTGEPADVAMAGSSPLKTVHNLIDTPVPILQNKEVILVPKDNPGHITGLKDLANAGVKLSLGTPGSAVGALSSQVLQKGASEWGLDYIQAVRKNIVVQKEKGSEVLAAVGKEANATITFASDGDPAKYTIVPIDDKYNVVSVYEIAVVKASKNQAEAKNFAEYVASPAGLAVLKKFRYMPPPSK